MKQKKTAHWTATYARQLLERAEKHNLSVTELAREQGVSPQRIHWWRKRLQAADAPKPPTFVEVKLATPVAHPFAIRTSSGRTVEVWPGFDAAELARLISVVETGPC
jgi:transposase-like protein